MMKLLSMDQGRKIPLDTLAVPAESLRDRTGKRISIKDTRKIIDAILDGSMDHAPTKMIPYFNLEVPTELHDVDSGILDPRDTYGDAAEWDQKAKKLSKLFIANFEQFTDNEEGKALVAAGPQL